jgi:hypothetical protein
MSLVRFVHTTSHHHIEHQLMSSDSGKPGIGFRIDERVIGELAEGERMMQMVDHCGLLRVPRQVGLIGAEEDRGVLAAIVLLVPSEEFPADGGHPLDAGLQGVRSTKAQDQRPGKVDLLRIGQVKRVADRRAHPDDLQAELEDMLSLLVHGHPHRSREQQAIEELLRGL